MSRIKQSLQAMTTDQSVVAELTEHSAFQAQQCTTFSVTTLFCPSSAH
jgi:hypothetical protein